jgi:Ribbon-helix-helix protein, copG family
MKKTSLYLDEEVDRALARRAAEAGVTKAEFIRRGLARLAAHPDRPRPTAIGFDDDGPTDLAANVDDYLREGGFGER